MRNSRSAISIIEVLTAIVVAMIGVFGVMAMIPFAVKQAQTGLNHDAATVGARNAFAQFEVKGYRNTSTWITYAPPIPPAPAPGAIIYADPTVPAVYSIDNRESYLRHLDGVTFGANPREGFTVGNAFYHPDLAFQLEFPAGWQIVNQRAQVGALSPGKDAIVVLSLAQGTAGQAAAEFRNTSGIVMVSSMGRNLERFETVSNNPNDQVLTGVVRFFEHRDVTLRLLAYTLDSRWGSAAQSLVDSVDSFRSLTDRRYLNVQPKRLELVELPRSMSLSDFAEAYPSSVDRTTLAVINGVSAEDVLQKGQWMKRIVGGDLPDR